MGNMEEIRASLCDAGMTIVAELSTGPTIAVNVTGAGPPGKTPEKGKDYWTDKDQAEMVQAVTDHLAKEGLLGGYKIGNGLKLDSDTNSLSVDVADIPEEDNTKPITSAAVFTTIGNIEVLLGTI